MKSPVESVRACKGVIAAGDDYELDEALKREHAIFAQSAPSLAAAVT